MENKSKYIFLTFLNVKHNGVLIFLHFCTRSLTEHATFLSMLMETVTFFFNICVFFGKGGDRSKQVFFLCFAMLWFAILCFGLLCLAVLCNKLLCHALPCMAMLGHALLCYALLCFATISLPCFALLCFAFAWQLNQIPPRGTGGHSKHIFEQEGPVASRKRGSPRFGPCTLRIRVKPFYWQARVRRKCHGRWPGGGKRHHQQNSSSMNVGRKITT